MRQLPKKQFQVRNILVGGEKPLICLPLLEKDPHSLLSAAGRFVDLCPDIIEWRVDSFQQVDDCKVCLQTALELRGIVGEIPILFTCRSPLEGGGTREKGVSEEDRLNLIRQMVRSGFIDFVDLELSCGTSVVKSIGNIAKKHEVKSIFSYHNFIETPSKEEMIDLLCRAQDLGANIAKLAVMPNCYEDVLRLLDATCTARTEYLSIPMVTIAMGIEGKISRVAGGLWGSDITFAEGKGCSAPGQLPLKEMREAMRFFYS